MKWPNLDFYVTKDLGPIDVGFRVQPRSWGLAINVYFEDWWQGVTVTFGPCSAWIERTRLGFDL